MNRKNTRLLIIIPVLVSLVALASIPHFALMATDELKLEPPIAAKTPAALIATVIKTLLAFLGALATLMFIYGGFTLILSAGNPEMIKKGQKTIVWAIVGLIVVLSSYGVMEFIFRTLTTGSVS